MAKHQSVAHMLAYRAAQTPNGEAFSYPEGGGWAKTTWSEVHERARTYAAGLRALGAGDEDRVGILSGTRVEWLLLDLGVNTAGCATTTIYPSSTPDDIQHIVADSSSVVVVAENDTQVVKLQEIRESIPSVKTVVNIDGGGSDDGWVITLADLAAKGVEWMADDSHESLDDVIGRITPERLATLIYTSGTTGKPKGVELLHDCWLYTAEAVEETGLMKPSDKQFLWLPLAHSFGKMLEVVVVGIGIPTAVDGDLTKIVPNLAVVKPTFVAAVPRIFEKVHTKVVTGAQQAGGLKLTIFNWATGVGKQVSKLRQQGQEPSGLLALQFKLADKLVFSKLRELFGGRLRFFVSGSAPLNRDIAEFFHAAGVLILEGYGLTESSAASVVNLPANNAFGTVGPPLPGTEVKIADDGEILMRSRGIMRGYHNLPEKTAETLDGRWLLTGDIGEFDANGRLRITDRKKDLIKTSGGKYVAPQALEGKLKSIAPPIGHVIVHGDKRKFCVALITLDPEAAKDWAVKQGIFGDDGEAALTEAQFEQLATDDKAIAMVQGYVDQTNATLASFETIKKFKLLPRDLQIETGELTPSLKVKRKAVEKKYMELLDTMY